MTSSCRMCCFMAIRTRCSGPPSRPPIIGRTGLRSHGGRHEQIVPIVVSHPLTERYAARHAAGVGNRDLHDLLLNGLA